MKLFLGLMFLSFNLWGQVDVLQNFDKKVYTPRVKAITDLVVDVENERITKQLNDQKIFGQVNKLVFRFYWTAQPERLAVEVVGLPEGFKEVKEELKSSVMAIFENVIPISLEKKFSSFNLTKKSQNIIEAKAKDNLSAVDSFQIVFDNSSNLSQITTNRAVGEMVTKFVYDKTSFSDGRLVLKSQETLIEEAGQKVSLNKEISYQITAGAGFPQVVSVRTRQSGSKGNHEHREVFKFSNYMVNKGEALKFFLSESK
ncbi:MAG: hypothetical protein WCY48_09710 [Candidatus Caldatribacteriota bacterium]